MAKIKYPKKLPAQHQQKPGIEEKMHPKPKFSRRKKMGGKLVGKVALVTGGDSGIGRAVAVSFAKEGADVCIIYLNEHEDAKVTKKAIEKYGRKCLLISGNIMLRQFCFDCVAQTIKEFKKLDILVNNAGVHWSQTDIKKISEQQLETTFRTNIFSYFYFTQAAVSHLKKGSCIINTSSITAYRGSGHLIDYASTKGAIISFTRSLAEALAKKGIRVNAVAPGPVWTPLVPSSFEAARIRSFGKKTLMKRPGQPEEIAPSFVFLASDDASYMTGQVLHPNGGEIING
ncbi:MAG: SDR family oxidoreductase [Chitinophagales bacterium]|nr:SDR family oxidoreductase [Bacteroidota bacterium]MBK7569949.1 SDR family oxidoreductase [Bacteroidota bacterium]MBP9221356.1 SDR family oxidoreductase [Chitinophagales bacterium]